MKFKCNKCTEEIDVAQFELWDLLECDLHVILCPHCDERIYVQAEAEWSFDCVDEDDV